MNYHPWPEIILCLYQALFRSSSTTAEVKDRIVNLLRKVIPSFLRQIFRMSYITNPKWICEMSSFCMSMGVFDWLVGPTQRFFVQSKERPMISLSASVETSTALKITGDKYCVHHIDDNNSIPTECLPIVAPAAYISAKHPPKSSSCRNWVCRCTWSQTSLTTLTRCDSEFFHRRKRTTQPFKRLASPLVSITSRSKLLNRTKALLRSPSSDVWMFYVCISVHMSQFQSSQSLMIIVSRQLFYITEFEIVFTWQYANNLRASIHTTAQSIDQYILVCMVFFHSTSVVVYQRFLVRNIFCSRCWIHSCSLGAWLFDIYIHFSICNFY
jgi:hypothetical protein